MAAVDPRFGEFIRDIPAPITVLGGSPVRFLEANASACQVIGWPRDQVVGSEPAELSPARQPDGQTSSDRAQEFLHKALAGEPQSFAWIHVDSNHDPRATEVHLSLLKRPPDPLWVAVVVDVTAHQETEQALRESEAKFRAIVQDQTELIVRWRPDFTRTFVNQAYCDHFGGTPADHIGTSFLPLVAEEDREAVRMKIRELTPAQPVAAAEQRVLCPDGSTGWQRWTDRAFFNKRGELVELQSVGRDITQEKQLEEQKAAAFAEVKRLKDELERERDYLREEVDSSLQFGDIVGTSPALRQVLDRLRAVAATDANVLIEGESGVGKELVARAIHDRSARRTRALIKVNCASIPRELFESEFFGHAKGAFTGAIRDRVGRFQLADGGTLFLDEVSEIPTDLQGKLLRVLQEGEFERVGEDRTRKVNARVIAATNRDLQAEVHQGRFRRDLYYRLSVFPLSVPPLRERPEDILPLAKHFLQLAGREFGRPGLKFRRGQAESLRAYEWPGNIRELRNVIERAVILSTGDRVRLDLAMPELTPSAVEPPAEVSAQADSWMTAHELRRLEYESIVAALTHTGWTISGERGAAKLLGLKPNTLRYRMKVLGISKPDKRG